MFDEYPLFVETSKTTKDPKLLNARYEGLIVANKDIIQNASILDLASHDGRWSFAALKNGASFAYGIEWRAQLVRKARSNMAAYSIAKEKYHFVKGDIFEEIPRINRQIDCIFCFGIFYHIDSHMLLLEKLSRLSAKHIIIDTNTSRIKKPVILLRKEQGGKMRLVGHPSKAGVEAMLANYGWQTREFDWKQSGLLSGITYRQYQSGRRITVIGSR